MQVYLNTRKPTPNSWLIFLGMSWGPHHPVEEVESVDCREQKQRGMRQNHLGAVSHSDTLTLISLTFRQGLPLSHWSGAISPTFTMTYCSIACEGGVCSKEPFWKAMLKVNLMDCRALRCPEDYLSELLSKLGEGMLMGDSGQWMLIPTSSNLLRRPFWHATHPARRPASHNLVKSFTDFVFCPNSSLPPHRRFHRPNDQNTREDSSHIGI